MYVAQPPQPRKRDRNRRPRLRARFHFNQSVVGSVGWEHSTNKTKWQLLALAEAKRLWAKWWEKKLTEREFWEIKVSLSWSNTVKLGGDQPLQWMTAEERRLSKTRHFFFPPSSSLSPTVSVTVTEHTAGKERAGRKRSVLLPWMKSSDKAGSSLSIWIAPYG